MPKPREIPKAQEATYLTLQRTANQLSSQLSTCLREFELTPTQYNVLRILRGAAPGALTCGEVGERLVSPDPDVTRLVDRLVKRGLAAKFRDYDDRRVVRITITAGGLGLLEQIEPGLAEWMRSEFSTLSQSEMTTLCGLLDKLSIDRE